MKAASFLSLTLYSVYKKKNLTLKSGPSLER